MAPVLRTKRRSEVYDETCLKLRLQTRPSAPPRLFIFQPPTSSRGMQAPGYIPSYRGAPFLSFIPRQGLFFMMQVKYYSEALSRGGRGGSNSWGAENRDPATAMHSTAAQMPSPHSRPIRMKRFRKKNSRLPFGETSPKGDRAKKGSAAGKTEMLMGKMKSKEAEKGGGGKGRRGVK